ncbi:hypothetical protein IMCC26207_110176 [Actinobacteria bacterium IMCC26207]|nr:hypothetical protein IMCC26207_110176 [Actinobacteria bacterium IMCC26207]
MSQASTIWTSARVDGIPVPSAGLRANSYRDESQWTVRVHAEFFDWLYDPSEDRDLQKRARYCLGELLTTGGCARRKNVKGEGKGWVRTQLGGTGGSHYYLWWAPSGYPAVDGSGLETGEVLVREVRHHDDTNQSLDPGSPDDWHVLKAKDILDVEESELTEGQQQVGALEGKPIRIVKGSPGSGKTTSMQQAASNVWGDKLLYLTYSSKLKEEAENYFTSFAPANTSVSCMTFGKLMKELGSDVPGVESPMQLADLIAKFESKTSTQRPQLGRWANSGSELYAELHAHSFGKALPVEFRSSAACSKVYVEPGEYKALRAADLNGKVALAAAKAAKFIGTNGFAEELFPSVVAARKLLDSSCADLPENFVGISAVMIDEVQDLTAVEAFFLLTVVGRIGLQSGQMPHLFVAGDEAQTVRPTAFDWGIFGDLLTLALGDAASQREEIALQSNMRSPKSVANLIKSTKSHYKLLHREDRPGDMSYIESDSDRDGKVLYCHAPLGDDWNSLVKLFESQSSAQFVYPGMIVPEVLSAGPADIATADQVKGLGYDLVGVVDAGERQSELVKLAAKVAENDDKMSGSLGRIMADQFRVAVSRSQENVVLLDTGKTDRSEEIQDLVSDYPDLLVRVDVAGLGQHLEEDVDLVDLIQNRIDDARGLLANDPAWALKKARAAVDLIPRAEQASELIDVLRRDVYRIAGLAAALAADVADQLSKNTDATSLRAEATELLAKVALDTAYLALQDLHASVTADTGEPDPSIVQRAAKQFATVAADLPELLPILKSDLSTWLSLVAESGFADSHDIELSIAASQSAAEQFVADQPDKERLHKQALLRTAELAEEAEQFERALLCLDEVEDADVDTKARCLEGVGRWGDAIEEYEVNDRPFDALRCARQIPDFVKAIELAKGVAPEQVGRLKWAQRLMELADPSLTDEGIPLTVAERDSLVELMTNGISRAVDATPTENAPVDILWKAEKAKPEPPGELPPAEVTAPEVTKSSDDEIDGAVELEESTSEDSDAPEIPVSPQAEVVLNVNGYVTLGDLAAEFSKDLGSVTELANKLGIATVGSELTITAAQAARLRRGIAKHLG